MSRAGSRVVCLALLAAASLVLAGAARATLYVRGNFCSTCLTPSPATQLYDDGLHDDLAAGDGVFGAIIASDRPPGEFGYNYTSEDVYEGPYWPNVLCCPAPEARLFTRTSGDSIHFRYRAGTWPDWGLVLQGASDHDVPVGSRMEVVTAAGPEDRICPPDERAFTPMQLVDGIWECVVTVPEAGIHHFCFRAIGGGAEVYFTRGHNSGEVLAWCEDFAYHTTRDVNSEVRFFFDSRNGLYRAVEQGTSPTERSTWGRIKSRYR